MLGIRPYVNAFSREDSAKLAVPRQTDGGQLGQLRLTDEVVGFQHAEFRSHDIRPPRQQLGGQSRGDRRQLDALLQVPVRQLEFTRRHANQRGKRIVREIARAAQFQQLVRQPVDFGLLAHNDGLRNQAAMALTLVDREYLPVSGQRLLLLSNLIVVLKNLEIGH
jgi:hypothetical protein